MQIRITPEQEEQLEKIAKHEGKADASALLEEAAARILAEDARFRAAVLKGKAEADRGEFIDEEEMDAIFEQMLRR